MYKKHALLIFLFGLIIGLCLSPFATQRPQEIIISPVVDNSLAQLNSKNPKSQIFKTQFLAIEDKTPKQFFLEEPNPSPKVQGEILGVKTISGKKTIAVLGDSMVDTMGKYLPYLNTELKKYYQNIDFFMLNYGVGGTNIEYGLYRLNHEYEYLGEKIPSLVSQNPDIIIVESFAYNHWSDQKSDLDRHWLALGNIITTLKEQTKAKILILSTIAPNDTYYGDGIGITPWTPQEKKQRCDTIRSALENTINFANSQGYPLIDAYHPSKAPNGEGKREYISYGDNLHPSIKGNEFIARLLAQKIFQLNLI
jgi:hypothetical protein